MLADPPFKGCISLLYCTENTFYIYFMAGILDLKKTDEIGFCTSCVQMKVKLKAFVLYVEISTELFFVSYSLNALNTTK